MFAFAPAIFGAEKEIEFPDASQHATITQRVGLTDVASITRDPTCGVGRFLVVWFPTARSGAPARIAPTKIKFSDAVKIDGQDLPAGEYAFYTIPNKDEWTIILSKNLKLWGAYGYKPDADALRVQVKPSALANPVETFTISLDDLKDNGATISLAVG